MFGMSPFAGPSTLRTLSSTGVHHPLPLPTSSPAVTAAYVSQVSLVIAFIMVFVSTAFKVAVKLTLAFLGTFSPLVDRAQYFTEYVPYLKMWMLSSTLCPWHVQTVASLMVMM